MLFMVWFVSESTRFIISNQSGYFIGARPEPCFFLPLSFLHCCFLSLYFSWSFFTSSCNSDVFFFFNASPFRLLKGSSWKLVFSSSQISSKITLVDAFFSVFLSKVIIDWVTGSVNIEQNWLVSIDVQFLAPFFSAMFLILRTRRSFCNEKPTHTQRLAFQTFYQTKKQTEKNLTKACKECFSLITRVH